MSKKIAKIFFVCLIVLISSCAVKLSKISIKTDEQKIYAKIRLINDYRYKVLGSNYIHSADIKWFKETCLKLNIDENININYDTTEVTIDLTMNGFERANSLSSEIGKKVSGFDIKFIKAKKTAVVWMLVDPTVFENQGEFLIENNTEISDFIPTNSNNNFKIIKQRENLVLFEMRVDTSEILNKTQEITYNYDLKDNLPRSEIKKEPWGLTNTETWGFIFAILGGIVSIVTIKNYKYRKK
jgi:hypothetical protein